MKPAAGKASRSRSRGHLRLISGPACPHPGHVDPTGKPSPHAHLAVGYDAVEEAALAQLALDIETLQPCQPRQSTLHHCPRAPQYGTFEMCRLLR